MGSWQVFVEEVDGCSNQEQAGEKKQPDRLGFNRARGAIL